MFWSCDHTFLIYIIDISVIGINAYRRTTAQQTRHEVSITHTVKRYTRIYGPNSDERMQVLTISFSACYRVKMLCMLHSGYHIYMLQFLNISPKVIIWYPTSISVSFPFKWLTFTWSHHHFREYLLPTKDGNTFILIIEEYLLLIQLFSFDPHWILGEFMIIQLWMKIIIVIVLFL